MGEAQWNPQLILVDGQLNHANPLTIGRGVFAHIRLSEEVGFSVHRDVHVRALPQVGQADLLPTMLNNPICVPHTLH